MPNPSKVATGLVVALALAYGAACDSPTRPDLLIEPIQVDGVDVLVLESFPAQASVHVTGVIGDGCSELHAIEQRRDGNVVTVRILRQRPAEATCTQIARLYDETIRLDGNFPPGDWVVVVNGVERRFRT